MTQGAKTIATLAVLGVVVVFAAAWGWNAMTAPFPGAVEQPTCVMTAVVKGEELYPSQVTVSVLNASGREGLAGRTMSELVDAGFAQGDSGNAPPGTAIGTAQIWVGDEQNPAIPLVRSWLGDAEVVRADTTHAGIVVVVGDDFVELAQGREQVRVKRDGEVCSPPLV